MSSKHNNAAASVIGIDIGKNSFHIVSQDQRGAIVLRQKWSRGQVEVRLANLPPCHVQTSDKQSSALSRGSVIVPLPAAS
jgi:hypothetical protein